MAIPRWNLPRCITGPIHLLMTDVVMPGISGRELSARVRAIRPEIRVLFMSGYTDQAVVHHGILETDAVLLQKPFTVAALAAKLRDISESRSRPLVSSSPKVIVLRFEILRFHFAPASTPLFLVGTLGCIRTAVAPSLFPYSGYP